MLGTELQMKKSFLRPGVQWLFLLLLLAGRGAGPAIRPIAERRELPRDARANCATPRSPTKTRSSTSWRRAVIRASGLSSRRCWKIASTSATRIRRFSSSSRRDEDSTTLDLIDPITLKAAGSAPVDNLTKIGTNNHLRRVLQTTLARFGLSSPDASVRLDAVRDIEQDLDEGNVQLLRERSAVETNSKVKKEIATGLALAALDGSDAQARLAAISTLRSSLRQDVLNKLQGLLEKSSDGSFVESDAQVRQAAAAAVKSISRWRTFYSGIETLFLWTEPRIRAGADRHRAGDYLRRHGRHQHGARRVDDARRVHHLRGAGGDARITPRSPFSWRFPRRFSLRR